MDDLLREFLTESAKQLDTLDAELVRFEREPGNRAILRTIFRLVHTIKGTCGFLGLPRLEALAHAAETVMSRVRDGLPPSAEAVSLLLAAVDRLRAMLIGLETSGTEPDGSDGDLIAALEHLTATVPELGPTRNQFEAIARRHADSRELAPLQRLSHVAAELQDGAAKARMQPIGTAWRRLPRVLRGLSAQLGKSIELVMQGAETELDRQVLDLIKGPLVHMVRNAADHGIEPAAERVPAGKPAFGTIRLSACREGGTIAIEIADDGRGLDLPAIRHRAVERSIAAQAAVERMSDAQAARFIFHAGLSTAAAVTTVSGRGVGMDVVRTNIGAIGGLIDIATKAGTGTSFTIRIPLTPAIEHIDGASILRLPTVLDADALPGSSDPRPANAA